MTPKEKARELFSKYLFYFPEFYHDEMSYDYNVDKAKECALIAVDEIIKAIDWHYYETPNNEIEYWEQVKQEIEKL